MESSKMNKKYLLIIGTLLLVLSTYHTSTAQDNPIQFSLIPSIQVIPENEAVTALRIAIYGKNTSVKFVDIGIVNQNTSGESVGVLWSLVGLGDDFTGWQHGTFYNCSQGQVKGLMTGLVNNSFHFTGVQVGLVNFAETAGGVQVGILNFIKKGGMLPFFPFFNLSL
jgi:hypothetical protein